MPSPYTEVQFIAFNVKPGVDRGGLKIKYLGEATAEKDMKARCTIMKEAIKAAYEAVKPKPAVAKPVARGVSNAVDVPAALKVFMAPEFYFRGEDGAYPIDVVSKILPELRKEIDKKIYADWLFVFGTAIGYLQHGDPYTEIKSVKQDAGKTVITLSYLPHGNWANSVVHEYAEVTITDTERLAGTDLRVSFDRDPGRGDGDSVRFCQPPPEPTAAIPVKSAGPHPNSEAPTLTLDCPPQNPCPECRCAAHVDNPAAARICKSCKHTHLPFDKGSTARVKIRAAGPKVTAVKEVGQDTYELTLDAIYPFKKGNYAYVDSALSEEAAEILNVALVRKGSMGTQGATGLREAVVYKEYVSPIDFLGPNYGKHAEFHKADASGRVVEVAQKQRPVMAPTGSVDVKGGLGGSSSITGEQRAWFDKNNTRHDYTISEINRSGMGGGSVFTIDEITYGLEVCLDHAKNRLSRFYDHHCEDCYPRYLQTYDSGGNCPICSKALKRSAASGDPKVQIHLIPSWGMTIGGGKVVCVANGPVFNVDGARAGRANASVLRTYDGKFGCDDDLSVVSGAGGNCTGPLCKVAACPCTPSARYDAKYVGYDCPKCGGIGTVAAVFAQLRKSGTTIAPSGGAKAVDIGSTGLAWAKFFEVPGEILVYPVQPIPAAETVA